MAIILQLKSSFWFLRGLTLNARAVLKCDSTRCHTAWPFVCAKGIFNIFESDLIRETTVSVLLVRLCKTLLMFVVWQEWRTLLLLPVIPTLDLFKSLIILIFSVPLSPLPCDPLLYMYTTNLPPTPFSVLSHPLLY